MAVRFGSSSAYYTLGASSDFNLAGLGDRAYVMVIKRNAATNSFAYPLSWGGYGDSPSFNINLSDSSKTVNVRPDSPASASFDSAYTDAAWYVIVAQTDGLGEWECRVAPVDGTSSPTVSTIGPDGTQTASDISALTGYIGGRSDQDSARFFEGDIHTLAILDATLSDANIQAIAAGDHLIDDIGLSPVSYHIFTSADATIADETGNGHTATRVGSPTTVTDPGFPAGDNIGITTIAGQDTGDKIVVQRVSGERSVAFTGSYSGSPTAIQARIVSHGTDTALSGLDWQTIDASPTGGTWSGSLTIPEGGWYNIDVRFSNDTDINNGGTTRFGVGDVFGLYGQSQMLDFYDTVTHTPDTPNDLASYRDVQDADAFASAPTDAHATTFLNMIIAETSLPAAVVGGAVGGTRVAQLSKGAGNDYFEDFVAALNETGVSFVFFNQGGSDVTASTAKATYAASLSDLFDDLVADISDTVQLGLSVLANRVNGTDSDVHDIRTAHMEYLAANSSVLNLGTNQDLTNTDNIHHDDAGQEKAAERMGLAALKGLGIAAYDARGPFATSAYVYPDDNKIRVNFSHRGGNSLSVDASGDPSSFEFFDDGSPITPTGWTVNASNVEATFSSIDAVSTYTVRIAYGTRDEDSGEEVNTRDNFTTYTTIGLPIGPTNEDITGTEEPAVAANIRRSTRMCLGPHVGVG